MTLALDAPLTAALPVTEADAGRIGRIAAGLTSVADGRIDTPEWVAAARAAWCDLPAPLRRGLRDFRRDSGPTGSLLVSGLPAGDLPLPSTPSTRGSVQRTAEVPATVLLMIAAGLGDPAAFRPEKTGALVQDVVPVPGQEDFQGNAGSVLLSFHNENAFHPHRPDFVMLLCLRADHEGVAGLRTACIRQVLPLLSAGSRDALWQDEYTTDAPPSFGAMPKGAPHAVLTGAADDPDVRVDFAATKPVTERARLALAELAELFDMTAQTVRLAPGDLAIVDNRVTVHGRTAFRPRYDGKDRWLQRSFVLTDLRRSRADRAADGYVLD
ncbi:TauD/TfdA family dioxygenase [Streptomyces sp. KLOTTS4A1]|uniref:TauD/TfdA family dioxygenase n=1 Tax=Streptomyces sp. KLOTTS4A1 TaxID=3390996 RepID=UPI0039F4E7D9